MHVLRNWDRRTNNLDAKYPSVAMDFYVRNRVSTCMGLFPVDFTFHTSRQHRTKYDQLGRACTTRLPLEDVERREDVDRDS